MPLKDENTFMIKTSVFILGIYFILILPVFPQTRALENLKQALPGFTQVSEQVYRAHALYEDVLFALKQLGIRTVINMNEHKETMEHEEAYLRRAGIETYWMPWDVFQ